MIGLWLIGVPAARQTARRSQATGRSRAQSSAGGPPLRITDFNDSYIFWFDWSRDGRLAAARGAINFDVVLITNFE